MFVCTIVRASYPSSIINADFIKQLNRALTDFTGRYYFESLVVNDDRMCKDRFIISEIVRLMDFNFLMVKNESLDIAIAIGTLQHLLVPK